MPNLVVHDLYKEFPTPAESLVVLRGVSLEMSAGESLAVVGPSGSGKSTLLHVIGTLIEPTRGSVRLNDVDPFALDARRLAVFRNQSIGFVFQDHHLLPQLTVVENVLLPALAAGPTTDQHYQRAVTLVDRVGLAARQSHRPAELSGGERQRVAVARALMLQPTLILADEPTGNLDSQNAGRIVDLLCQLAAGGEAESMLIVVTHSDEIARGMQRQVELVDGQWKAEI